MQKTALRAAARANPRLSVSFGESVDRARCLRAWELLVARHPMMRTRFHGGNGGPSAAVESDKPGGVVEEPDWSGLKPDQLAGEWKTLLEGEAAFPFGGAKGPWWRLQLIALPGGASHVLFSFHPALLDEDSVTILLREWLVLYDRLSGDGQPESRPTPNYAAVIGGIEISDEAAAAFWKEHLGGCRPCGLFERLRGEGDDGVLRADLDEEMSRGLFAAAAETGVDFDGLLAAVWGHVLCRWCGEADVATGVSRSVRSLAPEAGELCALLTATVPLRVRQQERGEGLKEAVGRTARDYLAMRDGLIADVEGITGISADRQFEAASHWRALTINDTLRSEMPRWLGLDAQYHPCRRAPVLLAATGEKRLQLTLEFDPHLDAAGMRELLDATIRALRGLAGGEALAVDALADGVVAAADPVEASGGSTAKLIEELAATARRHADLPAVEVGENTISHTDLDIYSNQLSHYLRQQRPDPQARVGICMTDTPWLPVAVIALVKEGGGFVWLEPARLSENPAEMVRGAGVDFIVADSATLPVLEGSGLPGFALDREWDGIAKKSGSPPRDHGKRPRPLFTFLDGSGKGVEWKSVPVDTLAACVLGAWRARAQEPGDRFLQLGVRGGAQAVEDILVCALSGTTVVQAADDVLSNRTAFQEALEKLSISHVRLPAALWNQWVHFLVGLEQALASSLRDVWVDGGVFPPSACEGWRALAGETVRLRRGAPVFGLAGLGLVSNSLDDGPVQHAKPMPGVTAAVLDPLQRPVPRGGGGVLAVSFPGLKACAGVEVIKRGFKSEGEPCLSLGLRAHVALDGSFSLLQAADFERKADLDASLVSRLEAALCRHAEIYDARIDTHDDLPGGALCAWVVPREVDGELPGNLSVYLAGEMPDAPPVEYFAALQRFPLDGGGRVDRSLLPVPTRPSASAKPTVKRSAVTAGGGKKLHFKGGVGGGVPVLLVWDTQPAAVLLDALGGTLPAECPVALLPPQADGTEVSAREVLGELQGGITGWNAPDGVCIVGAGFRAAAAVRLAGEMSGPVRLLLLNPAVPVSAVADGSGGRPLDAGLRKVFRLFTWRPPRSAAAGRGRPSGDGIRAYTGPAHVAGGEDAREALLALVPNAEFGPPPPAEPAALGRFIGERFAPGEAMRPDEPEPAR